LLERSAPPYLSTIIPHASDPAAPGPAALAGAAGLVRVAAE
jgi:hypothetical protein